MASERLCDLCTLFDQLSTNELVPLAMGLGLACAGGKTVPHDMLKAIGLALYTKGIRPGEMDRSFVEALNAATPRGRSSTA